MAHGDQTAPAAVSAQVKSATRTLDIIEYVVATARPLVAQEIAVALGIPVSSLSYLLSTLVERGYIVREGRRYMPGPGLERLQTSRGGPTLADRAVPLVQWLRAQLNETASFLVRAEWEAEVLVTQSSNHALRYSLDVGSRLPLHALAGGRALLTLMDEGELARYFAGSTRRRLTPSTIVDEGALRRAIAQAQEAGIAETDEEYSLGIHGMACVVMAGDLPAGALSVAIPKVRLTPERHEKAIKLLQRAATMLDQQA